MAKTDLSKTAPEHGKCPTCGKCQCCDKPAQLVPYPVYYPTTFRAHVTFGFCWCGAWHSVTQWTAMMWDVTSVASGAANANAVNWSVTLNQ